MVLLVPVNCNDMSPGVARLFELHVADGTHVVVFVHCQVSVGNHLRVVLRLLGRLRLRLGFGFGFGTRPLSLLGHVVSLLRKDGAVTDKLSTDGTADCVSLVRVRHEGRVGK